MHHKSWKQRYDVGIPIGLILQMRKWALEIKDLVSIYAATMDGAAGNAIGVLQTVTGIKLPRATNMVSQALGLLTNPT